ncbi:hypothetical protein [Flavobacterium aquicola]|nr:hypothetical protein [Flavobacterium aquicola]
MKIARKMKLNNPKNSNTIMAILFVLLFLAIKPFFTSCNDISKTKSDKSFDQFSAEIHQNSELTQMEGFFSKYKEISKGSKTIFEIGHYHESVKGALDAGLTTRLFFILKTDSLKIGKYYFFQNDDYFETYCLQNGAWIGIRKLYGTKGKFKLINFDKNSLKIKVEGKITSEILNEKDIENEIIIQDTIIEFK